MGSYLNERGKRILAALDAISAKHKVKPAAIALAWLMSRPMVIPIASATKPEQLEDFAAAAQLN
jgi:aryl-alcohol dehydrogenase-like predicted oxidoreductase